VEHAIRTYHVTGNYIKPPVVQGYW